MLDGCRFGLEDSTVVFYFEGMLCDGLCTSVGYSKPATCTMFSFGSVCKAANAMGTCFYDVRVEYVFVVLCEWGCCVGDSVAVVEDEFRFGNIQLSCLLIMLRTRDAVHQSYTAAVHCWLKDTLYFQEWSCVCVYLILIIGQCNGRCVDKKGLHERYFIGVCVSFYSYQRSPN